MAQSLFHLFDNILCRIRENLCKRWMVVWNLHQIASRAAKIYNGDQLVNQLARFRAYNMRTYDLT